MGKSKKASLPSPAVPKAKAQPKAKPKVSMPTPTTGALPQAGATAAAAMPTPATQTPERRSLIRYVQYVMVAFLGWAVKAFPPTAVFTFVNLVREWQHDSGLWSSLEIAASQCCLSDSLPLVAATLQYGRTLPEKYEHYENNTRHHELMLQTTKVPGVHAYYAEAGMGKSTVAAAVLQDLHSTVPLPAAFLSFEAPGKLKLQLATTLQTTTDKLSDDLLGALKRLNKTGFSGAVLVIDALDEHTIDTSDTETIKLLSGVSWKLLQENKFSFTVICLVRMWETKRHFDLMNGGHKITGGFADAACPQVPSDILHSYASRLHVSDGYKKWTKKAPYLNVVRRFAEGHDNMSRVVERYQRICDGGPSAGPAGATSKPVVWVRELARKDGTIIAKSRQEAEDELERAFQVSPKDHPDSRLNNVDDLATAIKQRKPITLKDVEADQIDVYSQEAGKWQRVAGASTSLRQDTSEPNPRWPRPAT